MDDLLVKQLTGEASREELAQVQEWLAADASNRRYFDHFKLIWEESAQLAAGAAIDENQAWQRFQQRVQNPVRKKAAVIPMGGSWWRVAAVLLVVAGAGWLTAKIINSRPEEISIVQVHSQEDIKKDTLPDGSFVTLNKQSAISYPTRFAGLDRTVQLQGEGFFAVQPDTSKPFIVQVNSIEVKVVGTSFNIRQRGDTIEIVVETGIVRVTRRQQTITLGAGEKTFITSEEAVLQKQNNTDQLYKYYRSRQFVCEGTPLWRLVERLNEAYDKTFVIENPALRETLITTTFNNEPVERIAAIISSTLDVTVEVVEDKVIIR